VFESGWTFDHFYPIVGDPAGDCMEGWTTLTALAQATRRLRLGTLVSGIHYRHPAVLANMAATLDIISAGRLEVGIGAGWNEQESGAYGIELGGPRERSDRFEEACEVIVSLLSREKTTFKGRYYELTEAMCNPKGIQHPHPLICIGGSGEKRTLRTAARFAQHWTPAEFAHKRDILLGHCAEAGRNPSEILLSSHVRYTGDAAETAVAAAELGGAGVDLAIVYLRPPLDPSVLEPLAAALSEV
jgi:F420-dependent oxidoreductase-like protein